MIMIAKSCNELGFVYSGTHCITVFLAKYSVLKSGKMKFIRPPGI